MGVGRFFCVALPFALTLASLICLLIATLAGVTNKDLYIFRVNTTDLSISPTSITSLISTRDAVGAHIIEAREDMAWHDPSFINGGDGKKAQGSSSGSSSGAKTSNITAADLGIADLYDISLWGYCYTDAAGVRACTKPAFDWAASGLNTSQYTSLTAGTGVNVELPKQITDALKVFTAVTKWTEVVFIIALIALGVELLFGLFATCSRVLSCVTFIVSGVASVAVIGAASMSTAMAVVVVGTVESTARFYGVQSNFSTSFLALVWLAVAFALGAGFFWLFTICCCAPSHGSSRKASRSRGVEAGEKFMPHSAYQPLQDDHYSSGAGAPPPQYPSYYASAPQYGKPRQGPRSDIAYEPYSHA